jgi:hypothetical protein
MTEYNPDGPALTHARAAAWVDTQNLAGDLPRVPAPYRNESVRFSPLLGFQPLSIVADPNIPDRFAICDYYAPAIVLVRLVESASGDLMLQHEQRIGWVNPPPATKQPPRVRLFRYPPSADFGAARAESVTFFGDNGDLLIGPNECKDELSWIYEKTEAPDHWALHAWPLKLTGDYLPGFIESLLYHDNMLYVLKSREDGSNCWLELFVHDPDMTTEMVRYHGLRPDTPVLPKGTWVYGPAHNSRNHKLYFITDPRSNLEHGIYCENKLVTPGITGNGLAFAADGALLVTQYNMSDSPFGTPGAIVRVPPNRIP